MGGAAVIGASLLGGAMSMSSAGDASDAQYDAAQLAAQTDLAMFNKSLQVQAPWRKAGRQALNVLMGKTAYKLPKPDRAAYETDAEYQAANKAYLASAYRTKGLLMDGPGAFKKSPGYEFRRSQGEDAVKNYLSASGLSTGGPGMKALTEYNQNFATNEYDNFLTRYYQSLNPYLSMAGMGQGSATNASNNAITTGTNVANTQIAAGDARASGYINQSNAITGGIQSGVNNYLAYSSIPNYGGGGGSGYYTNSNYDYAANT